MASCREIESLIQGYIDGELSDSERVLLEDHAAECSGCTRVIRQYKRNSAALYEAFAPHRLDHDLASAVMTHLPEMDRSPLAVQEVNYRVKHAAARPGFWVRLTPALAPALIVALAFLMFAYWPQDKSAPENAIGLVTYRAGNVLRSDVEGTVRKHVDLRSFVASGERFETGPGAAMMISLAGPTEVKLAEDTRVRIDGERQVSVERGSAWLHVGKDVRLFRVKTPTGDAVVFGTSFGVRVDADSATVTVSEGLVQVENDVTFRELAPGEQATLVPGRKPLDAKKVDAAAELAWAGRITADGAAQQMFAESIEARPLASMAAEQVFVVQTNGRAVQSLTFEWARDRRQLDHGGYYVHVYDDQMNQLFVEHIRGDVFDTPGRNSYDIVVPGEPIRSVRVLHIKVLPDGHGPQAETAFTKVSAWGIYP